MGLNNIKINNTTNVKTGVVYDISKATGQSYETLSDALDTDGRNVPLEVREGGMSIRFVTSDNKYVQYRLMTSSWSASVGDWEQVVEAIKLQGITAQETRDASADNNGYIVLANGKLYAAANAAYRKVDVEGFRRVRFLGILQASDSAGYAGYAFYDETANPSASSNTGYISGKVFDKGTGSTRTLHEYIIDVPEGAKYLYVMSKFQNAEVPTFNDDFYCYIQTGFPAASTLESGSFDVSLYNKTSYASLSDALAAIPSDYRRGGMSVKFKDSDNKYVEYFLTKNTWSASEGDWQKMNLEDEVSQLDQEIYWILGDDGKRDLVVTGQILATGNVGATASTTPTSVAGFGYIKESCSPGDIYLIYALGGQSGRAYAFCDSSNKVLESVASLTKYCGLVFAPANTSYIVVNNNFSSNRPPNLTNPVMYKITTGALNSLYTKIISGDAALGSEINTLRSLLPFKYLQYTSFVTGYFIGLDGQNKETSGENRQINTYAVSPGKYSISRLQGNQYTRGWRLKDGNGNILALGPIGGESIIVNESVDVTVDGTLDVFFMSTEPCTVINITDFGSMYVKPCLEDLEEEIAAIDKKATNVGGYYLKNNKILLSGASISSIRNGYFEYAMQELGIDGLNISEPAVNIYYLAYKLYSNSAAYADYDILIMSHIHNFDVFTLPAGKENYSVSDYENDSVLGDYIKTTSHYSGNLTDASGYTANELYAMGFDYCIKKWAALCYAFKDVAGYNSVFGKPCQIILYTYWHDARTIYNEAVRKLAKKWCFLLIKDDENVGFSKDRTHPVTGQQWSRLYADTTGFTPTETIDGVIYGLHPDRITQADYNEWQTSGVLLQSYLPFIQKVRSAILMNTLKDSLIRDINP